MKTSIKLLCCGFFLICFTFTILAQESTTQKFIVHEDVVFPSKIVEYEAASKLFAETMAQHNATEAAFATVSLDDNRYLYLSAIDNLAALDANPFKAVSEAMGEEAFDEMMSKYDGTFETHKNYVINLNHDLSYKSAGIVMDGVNYRQLSYTYITPGKWEEAKAISKEWNELHKASNAPHGYRIYTGGLGTEPTIMVVRWAKSEAELYAQIEENRQAIGDVSDLWNRTMAITRKRETYGAWMRPDLSYQPKSAMADN